MRDNRSRGDQLIVGRLLAHGSAPYQFRRHQDVSYYLKVLTQHGERTLWGKDIGRALATSATQPKIGDMVGARRIGREPVTITSTHRDAAGRVTGKQAQAVHRYLWVVEKPSFFAERAKLARRLRDAQLDTRAELEHRPELLSAFVTLRGAQEVAARRIQNPEDRTRFLELVREAMEKSIKRGEPLPDIRLREPRTSAAPLPKPTRDDDKTR